MAKATKCGECPQFEVSNMCDLFGKPTSAESGCIQPDAADRIGAREIEQEVKERVVATIHASSAS